MRSQLSQILRGHCLCGAVQFTLEGPSNWVGHCHCDSCRRATSSPMTTWIGQQDGRWTLTGRRPTVFASSPGQQRGFCPSCGSQVFYRSSRYPRETHFYAALLEDPNAVTPAVQFHEDEKLRWLDDALTLPVEEPLKKAR
ncbi:MAG: GFA family protein [Pseudomonadota bacterium]